MHLYLYWFPQFSPKWILNKINNHDLTFAFYTFRWKVKLIFYNIKKSNYVPFALIIIQNRWKIKKKLRKKTNRLPGKQRWRVAWAQRRCRMVRWLKSSLPFSKLLPNSVLDIISAVSWCISSPISTSPPPSPTSFLSLSTSLLVHSTMCLA